MLLWDLTRRRGRRVVYCRCTLKPLLRTHSLERYAYLSLRWRIISPYSGYTCKRVYFDVIYPFILTSVYADRRRSFNEKWRHKYNRLNTIYGMSLSHFLVLLSGNIQSHPSCRDGKSGTSARSLSWRRSSRVWCTTINAFVRVICKREA